jgi:peroxin-13
MGMMNRPFNRMMEENSLTQQMELSTQSTFQVLDQIVQSFMGFSNMLESTFFATHSSFMAMVGVAEQFGHLKTYLGEVFSIVSLYQTIKNTLYRMSGRAPPNVPASNPSTPKPSKKPLFVFVALVLGVPYLISMLMKHIKPKALDIKSIEFCKALYDFHSDQPGELSFIKGDLVAILGKMDPEWWKGRTQDGRIGLFPRSYVQVIPKQIEPVPVNDFASEFQTPNSPINIA